MLILVFLLYLFIASTFTLSKALVTFFPLLVLIVLRFLIGGGLLLIGTLFFNSIKIFKIKPEDYKYFLQIILGLYCFGFILDNYAIIYIESSFSSLIYNLSPFVTAILSYFLFKRKLYHSQLIGLCIGFSSLSVLFLNDFYFEAPLKICTNKFFLLGAYAALLIAVIANAYGWIIFEKLLKKGYQTSMIHCISLLGAGFFGLLLILLSNCFGFSMPLCYSTNPVTVLGSPFFDLIVLIIVSHILCAVLYGNLLKVFSPTFVAFAGCITPLFVALFGFVFLNEKITWHFFVATAGVSLGLLLFYKSETLKGIYLK